MFGLIYQVQHFQVVRKDFDSHIINVNGRRSVSEEDFRRGCEKVYSFMYMFMQLLITIICN